MYRCISPGQLSFENFYLPFGGKLSGENRWVKLAQLIPWEVVETEYSQQFSSSEGAPAKSCRVALGALIIKERLGTSDEETVEQIRENPYLQYFLGFYEYQDKAPFETSMFVHFRKRFSIESVGRINEKIVEPWIEYPSVESNVVESNVVESDVVESKEPGNQDETEKSVSQEKGKEIDEMNNQGYLVVDATCAPVDIQYPTDLRLLNEAREHTESIIDVLYESVRDKLPKKPRTYRQKARRDYLKVAKKRRPTTKQRRRAIGQQLAYVRRNLAHIDVLMSLGASLTKLSRHQYRTLLVVSELFRQQQCMYEQRSNRIDERIVSLVQPHVRPIIRGKVRVSVEFGPKLSTSCSEGFIFIDHFSWNNFNESGYLQQQAEAHKTRFGNYPQTLYADQIYRTKANRTWCKEHGIRLMGLPTEKLDKDEQVILRQQFREDEKIRNQIEGKFGQGKRRFSLSLVMAKLASTAETAIAISFLVMNLEHLLRQVLLFIFCHVVHWIGRIYPRRQQGRDSRTVSTCMIAS